MILNWILFCLLIVSNLIWVLIYKALVKIIKTYRNIILSTTEFKKEVLEKMDGLKNNF